MLEARQLACFPLTLDTRGSSRATERKASGVGAVAQGHSFSLSMLGNRNENVSSQGKLVTRTKDMKSSGM